DWRGCPWCRTVGDPPAEAVPPAPPNPPCLRVPAGTSPGSAGHGPAGWTKPAPAAHHQPWGSTTGQGGTKHMTTHHLEDVTRVRTPSAEQLLAWRTLLIVHAQITRRLEAELIAEHELPLASYDVLVQLAEADGRALRMIE